MAATQEHRALYSLMTTVLDTIIDGVITIDERGHIQSYNKACVRLFGYALEEVIGKNINMLMPEPYHSAHDGYLESYKRTGKAKIIGIGREVSAKHKNGTVFPVELAVGETHRGGDHAFVGVIRDLTERKEAEKSREQLRQAQKMESLGQLTGGIAHDFNNLLAVILGNLDFMMERTKKEEPLRHYIVPAIAAAEHGAELTKRLLAFGRKQSLQPKTLNINELLERFLLMLRHSIDERTEVILGLKPDLWNVHIDPNQLENALLNLAVNARDAMPNGGKLIFETKNVVLDEDYQSQNPDVVPGEYVLLAVTDTGTGMSKEVISKAFEPFFTTKEVGKGSGLGLSMVYGFVKQSQGHLQLYSEVGHGTSIKIYLPRDADAKEPLRDEREYTASIAARSIRILIVEDNKEVLALTSAMVKSLGYDVLTAEEGDTALALLKANPNITLLLSDVMLPGTINGPELAKKAVALYPSLKVLFNSGYAEHAIRESGLLEEGVNLIGKPFRKQQLAEKIEEVLNSED